MKKEYPDKTEYYNDQGELHRLDGPALEYNDGDKYWYINDKLHREDGPAVEWTNGKLYFLNHIQYNEDMFHQELIKIKLKRLINEEGTL